MSIVTILIVLYGGYGLWYLFSNKFGHNVKNENVGEEENVVEPTQPIRRNEGKQRPVWDISEPDVTPAIAGSVENLTDEKPPVEAPRPLADDAPSVAHGTSQVDESEDAKGEDQQTDNDIRLVNNGDHQDIVMNIDTLSQMLIDNYTNGYNDGKGDLDDDPELDPVDPNDDAWESDYADESPEEREEDEEIEEREMERDNPSTDEDDADWDAAGPQYSIDGTPYDNWNHSDDEDDEYTKYYS